MSLKAELVEVTEEHKISLTLNSKTVNSLVKMNEKTGCCHVILIYGLIPPSASKNRVHTVILLLTTPYMMFEMKKKSKSY